MSLFQNKSVSRETNGNKSNGTKSLGNLGESIASQFLVEQGHIILKRNFSINLAEIDIISSRDGTVHFTEVKSVSHETKQLLIDSVTRGTWRPEEKVTQRKIEHIHRAAAVWIEQNDFTGEWQINVIAVRIVPRETFASVNFIENIT